VEDYDVVIVGGGIGGFALGCALTSNGRRTCVLEVKPGVTRSKRGLTLQPNGLAALGDLGLLDRVVGIGTKTTRVAWYEIGGKPLATLEYSVLDHPHNYLLTVVPSELELLLRDVFSKRGGIIHESTFFREIIPARFQRVLVRADRDGFPLEFSARIIVGADGVDSRVRQAIEIPVRIKEYLDHFFFMLAGPVASLRLEARQYVARGEMAGFFPTPESTYIFYYVPSRTIREFKSHGLESFKKRLANIEPDVSDSLSGLESWEDVADNNARRVDVKTWVTDRAALLGDAVHALDPSWAQGANLSLQDAVSLANTIESCFEFNVFTARALAGYEKERRKQTEFVQNGAERTARLTTTESGFYYRLGKRVLQRTSRDKELMRVALKASCGLTDHFSLREMIRFII
jgi:2-polyprenyl-6-methoxyphenol hydroxylase-like FAD-dependent oxidoreductase